MGLKKELKKEVKERKTIKREHKLTSAEIQELVVDEKYLKPKPPRAKKEKKKTEAELMIEKYEANVHPEIMDEKDFKIDPKTFNITHKDWKGTYIQGGQSKKESKDIIKRYIKECLIPDPADRNLYSFVHLVHDN